MGTQLNIKSEDAYLLASKLAEMTGESLTGAVTRALQERLERLEAADSVEVRLARVREITADIRANMIQPLPSSEHGWMYHDATGLPE